MSQPGLVPVVVKDKMWYLRLGYLGGRLLHEWTGSTASHGMIMHVHASIMRNRYA
jgi:hypothetical protein